MFCVGKVIRTTSQQDQISKMIRPRKTCVCFLLIQYVFCWDVSSLQTEIQALFSAPKMEERPKREVSSDLDPDFHEPPISSKNIYKSYVAHRKGFMCHDPQDGTERLFEIFMNGLPHADPFCPQLRVVIVGGGVAGLTAAKLLKDAGHHVLILEANNQIGGRVQTYRDLSEGWHVELGAMRIPNHATFLLEFIKQKRIQVAPFRAIDADEDIYVHNRSGRDQELESIESEKERYEKLFDHAMSAPKEAFRTLPWPTFLKIYDQYSLKQWLQRNENLTHEDIQKMAVHFNFEGYVHLGLTETVVDECAFTDPEFHTIPNGMDEIPRAMAEDMGGHIRLNAKVIGISQEGDHVTVKVDCQGTNCQERELYFADAVILTTSPTVTTTIQFKPPLPRQKAAALRRTNSQLSTKVVLVFHSPFWERQGVGVLLASYTWGTDSLKLIGMSDDDVIEKCLEALAQIHHQDLTFIKEQFLRGVVKHWSLDPFTLGAFAQFAPFEYSEVNHYLRRPVGTIFFAGEYTESPHAWIDTAMKSGVRACAQMIFGPNWKSQTNCLNK
eukprot:TCALIF_13055-PA protein Name:"Similar to L-amino-acid oxidase (Siganus canaliculatus)" AED:0.03 eAED:0.03 QI:30/0.85/0.75/1/1/1/8/23/553